VDSKDKQYLQPEQVKQLFQYLQRETSLQDYFELYPDFQNRFAILVSALPEQYAYDALSTVNQIEVPADKLSTLIAKFNLTEREAQLALFLLAGHSPVDIAKIRKVSRNTIRNQLQNVYDNTATRKQPELIRRLHDVLRT
jgi:DNA-binding CsgD family transcriptional regulator